MWKSQPGIWQTVRKSLEVFLVFIMTDTHHHCPLSVSFPFFALDKRVLPFLPLLYYRLTTPVQGCTQHQQWHALFQQQKGKRWHLIWENIGNGRGNKINWLFWKRPTAIQAPMRVLSPQNTKDREMCECNRCRDVQAGSAHGSLGLPGLMRAAQLLLC